MPQFAVQDRFLFRVSSDNGLVGIDVVDIETGRAFSLHKELESAEAGIVDAIFLPAESKHVHVAAASGADLTLTYTRVLPSGLELRPQLLAVPAAGEPLSLVSMIAELCRENAGLRADAARINKESELRSKCFEDIVAEKEAYQTSMLERVSAILDDRNARIAAALVVKEEPAD